MKNICLVLSFRFIVAESLAESFDHLNSSLALSVPKIFSRKDTCKLLVLG